MRSNSCYIINLKNAIEFSATPIYVLIVPFNYLTGTPSTNRLKLQSEGRNLKRSQHNTHLPTIDFQFLAIILKHVGLPDSLNIQSRFDAAPARASQGVENAKDDTSALPLWQLATTNIFVIFSSLHRIEDEGWIACQLDIQTVADSSWAGALQDRHRVIEIITGSYGGAG